MRELAEQSALLDLGTMPRSRALLQAALSLGLDEAPLWPSTYMSGTCRSRRMADKAYDPTWILVFISMK